MIEASAAHDGMVALVTKHLSWRFRALFTLRALGGVIREAVMCAPADFFRGPKRSRKDLRTDTVADWLAHDSDAAAEARASLDRPA